MRARASQAQVVRALAIVAVLLAAAYQAVGRPDLSAAHDFFAGTYPTQSGVLAAAQVVIWLVLLGLVLSLVRLAVVTESRSAVQLLRQRRQRALVVLGAGLLLLGIGLARHSASDYSMCCGSVEQARQVMQAVK